MKNQNMQNFNVSGMTCQSCVEKIQAALKGDPRIHHAEVNLSSPQIKIHADSSLSAKDLNLLLAPLIKYKVSDLNEDIPVLPKEKISLLQYMPLLLLFGLAAIIPAAHVFIQEGSFETWMMQFMGISLIALSYFKLIDLVKFRDAFMTYDPIAIKIPAYGMLYPFLELATGIGFVLAVKPEILSVAVILLLAPTTYGVIDALRQNRKFQCACLGTVFNLPLTKVTIVENALMIFMSLIMLNT